MKPTTRKLTHMSLIHIWKNADNYDLCINSAVLGWDKCVSLVKSYLDIKLS